MKRFLFIILLFALTIVAQARNTERAKRNMTIIEKTIALVKEKIYNPNLLNTPEWKAFEKEIRSEKFQEANSDQELIRLFNIAKKQLPFSHLNLSFSKPLTSESNDKGTVKPTRKYVELKELNDSTAYLIVYSFNSPAIAPMMQAVGELQSKKYSNLIIDLRDNTGGVSMPAVILGQFITNQPIDAGAYITRNWYNKYEVAPKAEDIQKMPFLQDMTFETFQKNRREYEGFRMMIPPHNRPTYQGNVFLLTNGSTGSTCEPLADLFKKKGLATLIGCTTTGGMLSGYAYSVNDDIEVFVPVCDYITAEGNRIDQVGVTPHIRTSSDDALDKALEIISKQ